MKGLNSGQRKGFSARNERKAFVAHGQAPGADALASLEGQLISFFGRHSIFANDALTLMMKFLRQNLVEHLEFHADCSDQCANCDRVGIDFISQFFLGNFRERNRDHSLAGALLSDENAPFLDLWFVFIDGALI